jgi:hypothetical protein
MGWMTLEEAIQECNFTPGTGAFVLTDETGEQYHMVVFNNYMSVEGLSIFYYHVDHSTGDIIPSEGYGMDAVLAHRLWQLQNFAKYE